MAHLARSKRCDLITLVAELNLVAPENSTKSQLVNIITKSDEYDEALAKSMLEGIVSEREEIELHAHAKEKEEREFELKKLQIESASKNLVEGKTSLSTVKSSEVLKLMAKYNAEEDISIYLNLFERQIKRLGVEKENYVTYLLGLLPLEIVSIIGRENDELADDYDYIKRLLLKRFKLTPEQFRMKFFTHKKETLASWKDFAYEINNFLEEWINGLGVVTFEGLKDLLIIDQVRRKLPCEMRDHFIDDIPKLTKLDDFIEKLDDYEAARNNIKKFSQNQNIEPKRRFPQNQESKSFQKNNVYQNKYDKNVNTRNNSNQIPFKIKCFHCNEYATHKSSQCPLRKEGIICFKCKQIGHKADQCTLNNIKQVNLSTNISVPSNKIVKLVEIRGKNVQSIVDSGSDVTIISDCLYRTLGRPDLRENNIKLSGISGNELTPDGYFNTDVSVDNIAVNCDVYVMKNLQYDMIIGNNILSQINFEISDGTIKVKEKRNVRKNCSVNLVTIVPLNSKLDNSGQTNSNHLDNPKEIETSILSANKTLDINETKTVYLSEIADSINVNELDVAHVTNCEIKKELINLVENYKPEKTKKVDLKVKLILNDDIPIAQRPRRLAYSEQEFVDKQIKEWLEQGIIRESCSDYAAPIVLAKKKNGKLRLCVDYRKINKKIIRDNYPLPLIDEVLDNIGQNKVFSTLDLKNGFFHVNVDEESKKYTSFVTNNSQFEYNVMPFGLSVAPQQFQRYIFACLKELIKDKTILVYMDDIIVLAESEEEALIKLKRVFQVASEYGLNFNFSKCQFLKRKIEFLGYVIENGTIRPSNSQTEAVEKFPQPQNKKQLQSFLGLTGYFRKYIADYAKIAKPLSDLLKAESEFNFGQTQKEAFNVLKIKLSNKPVLHIFRRGAETELHTDASSLGFGAVLLQKDDYGNLHPVYFMSRKTTPAQAKYSSYELEALAVVEALKKFRTYLLGNKFKIITDCSAFQKTLEKKDLTPKVARWALFLQEFDYQIIHRPGNQMKHADALSRNTILILTRSQDEITTKLAKAQNEDDYIQTIKSLIEKNESNDYFLKQSIVYKYENGRELIMVPENMQKEIIREHHNRGHYAVAKTEALIKQDFYIPNLRKQIESVIGNCIECILCNRKKGKAEGLLNPIPKENLPLQTYHIDHLGPMPSTNKNYNYIFTVTDAFTKFIWFYPVKTTSAKEVISKLKIQQATFGNPSRIISDRGTAFTSNEFKKYLEDENIDHVLITTGIPRGNGQIERVHETLIPILTKLSIDDHTKWYKYVPSVQRIINSTYARSTKFSPFELLTGVKIKNKEDLKIRQILDEELENSFIEERQKNREIAKQNILKIQEENRKCFNRKRKMAKSYQVGDLVAIQKTQFCTGAKLRPKFLGPYKITKVKNNDRYDVEKVGFHDGPAVTSSAADYIKPWAYNN